MRTGGCAGTGPGSTDGAASCIRGLGRTVRRSAIVASSPPDSFTLAWAQPSGGAPSMTPSASVSAATASRYGRIRGASAPRSATSSIRSSSSSAAIAPQVLDGPLELAGVALGTQFVGELDVDHDHEPLVVRDRGSRARRGHDLDLVRCEHQAGDGDAAVGADLEVACPRRGHHGGDRGSELPADLRQERLDPPLDELGFVADPDDLLDVDLVRDHLKERVKVGMCGAGERDPQPREGLARLEAGLRAERASQLDRALARAVAASSAASRSGASSAAGQRVRWTDSGPSTQARR